MDGAAGGPGRLTGQGLMRLKAQEAPVVPIQRFMKRLLPAIAISLTASACVTQPVVPTLPGAGIALPRRVRIQFVEQGVPVVRDVLLEDYVRVTAISEFAPAAGDLLTVERMLEVQTIISRSYAVSHRARHGQDGFDLCATTHCQLFDPGRVHTSRWSAVASEAVARTAGVVLNFDGQPAQALFHADCGGHTSASAAVWGGDNRPYLVARADDGVAADAHASWQYSVAIDAVTRALNADARTRIGDQLEALEILGRDDAGRAERISIRSQPAASGVAGRTPGVRVVRAEDLRQVLTRAFGPRAIRSTWFDVRRDEGTFTFTGRGFGHGVGLCQAGALARLQAGATPADVIRFYYPGTTLLPSPVRVNSRTTHGSSVSHR